MRSVIAATIMLAASSVAAHDHYDPWCCNGKDCKPYHGKVYETPQGYFVPEFNVTVPYKNAHGIQRPAAEAGTRYNLPDDAAKYHACVMPWEPTVLRCFYARQGGV